jgi:hypothetical protein
VCTNEIKGLINDFDAKVDGPSVYWDKGTKKILYSPPKIEATKFKNKHCIFQNENKMMGQIQYIGHKNCWIFFSSPSCTTCLAYLMYVLYVFVQFHFPVFKKPKRMSWAEYVACIREKMYAYRILVGKHE